MKTILVAEDSSVIQNLTKKILQFQNFEIVSARNGSEVLRLIEQRKFHLILMDINMPVMDGLQCAKLIRASGGQNKDIPIIAITGNAKNHSNDVFESAGINEFMQKPLNFDLLVERVKALA